jgi:hypothetical protein
MQYRLVSCSRADRERFAHVGSLSFFAFLPSEFRDVSILYPRLLTRSRAFVLHIDRKPLEIPESVLSTPYGSIFHYWYILREFHKYVGCDLSCGLEEFPLSVVNLPCDFHSALQRSHLSDFLLLVILFRQKFDGKQCIIDSSILFWSWCRTCAFFSHSPSLSRISPSVRNQSPVKVDVIVPLLCSKNVTSSVVCSRFLDTWHSHEKVDRFQP